MRRNGKKPGSNADDDADKDGDYGSSKKYLNSHSSDE